MIIAGIHIKFVNVCEKNCKYQRYYFGGGVKAESRGPEWVAAFVIEVKWIPGEDYLLMTLMVRSTWPSRATRTR